MAFQCFQDIILLHRVQSALEKAIIGGVTCALGLLTVFSLVGVIASIVSSFISKYIPFLELIAGLITILLGFSMIIEIELPVSWMSMRAWKQRNLIGIFFYGIAYGLATIGCSAPIFFSVLFYAIVFGGLLYGILIFIVYAFGMKLSLVIATIIVARARGFILKRMIKTTPLLHRLSGIILVFVGVYLVHYYFTVLYVT